MTRLLSLSLASALALSLSGCATSRPAPDRAAAVVAEPDRTPEDRALDPGRKPAQLLSTIRIAPGMKVGELMAGGGYTTELLARAVGPEGKVYAENPPIVLEKFAAKPWAARLARPVNANVVRLDREMDDPFPPEIQGQLDLVLTYAVYHDAVWMNVDRAKMNAAVFAALKPGGRYVVVDSSARPGTGTADAETLHRIDEDLVRKEVEAAGFRFEGSDDYLRHPEDTRDWSVSPRAAGEKRGTGDRFQLRFVKP